MKKYLKKLIFNFTIIKKFDIQDENDGIVEDTVVNLKDLKSEYQLNTLNNLAKPKKANNQPSKFLIDYKENIEKEEEKKKDKKLMPIPFFQNIETKEIIDDFKIPYDSIQVIFNELISFYHLLYCYLNN